MPSLMLEENLIFQIFHFHSSFKDIIGLFLGLPDVLSGMYR
jgi:hypothetical protein